MGVEFKPLVRPLFRPGLLLPAGTCRIICCYPTDHLCTLHPSPFASHRKLSDSISALRNAHYLHSKYEDLSLSYGRKEDCLVFWQGLIYGTNITLILPIPFFLTLYSLYLVFISVDGHCCAWSHSVTPTPTHAHTHTHARTLGRTPLDKGPARRRELYLTKHNIHKRQTLILPVGFEPAIPVSEQLRTHSLDRAAVGIDIAHCLRCISCVWHCGIWFHFLLNKVAVIVLRDCRYRCQCKKNTNVRISVM